MFIVEHLTAEKNIVIDDLLLYTGIKLHACYIYIYIYMRTGRKYYMQVLMKTGLERFYLLIKKFGS